MKEFIFERLDKLEAHSNLAITELEVRNLLNDKLTPLQEDVHELRTKIDEIYSLLINKQ